MDEQIGSNIVDFGVDLSEFYMSVEWDILEVPAVRWDINRCTHVLQRIQLTFAPVLPFIGNE